MRVHQERIDVTTAGTGLLDVTAAVSAVVARSKVTTGLVTVFVQHTSASLLIQENASPDVRADLAAYFERIAPENSVVVVGSKNLATLTEHFKSTGLWSALQSDQMKTLWTDGIKEMNEGLADMFQELGVEEDSLVPPSGSWKRMRTGAPSRSHSSTDLKSLSAPFGSKRRRCAPSSEPAPSTVKCCVSAARSVSSCAGVPCSVAPAGRTSACLRSGSYCHSCRPSHTISCWYGFS